MWRLVPILQSNIAPVLQLLTVQPTRCTTPASVVAQQRAPLLHLVKHAMLPARRPVDVQMVLSLMEVTVLTPHSVDALWIMVSISQWVRIRSTLLAMYNRFNCNILLICHFLYSAVLDMKLCATELETALSSCRFCRPDVNKRKSTKSYHWWGPHLCYRKAVSGICLKIVK